jgi:prepilin signal peptidase PulO-like enzyme (type II secretory pathway)
MAFFACTLIAVCVTDFREKLIPHDITYPSMLLGILFSATVRHDALGTMAGIGASYILFDFLAFYGLKIYFLFNKEEPKLAKKNVDLEEKSAPAERDEVIDQNFALATPQDEEDDFEVMGGGDAVLSAVISAWLGWQRLILALLMGFLIGTLMGAFYLIIEMKKEKMLKRCIKPMVISMLGCIALTQSFLIILSTLTTQPFTSMPWAPVAIGAAVIGAILGIIIAGSHVSKPFPFGPALAAGAAVAMFYNPVGSLGSGGA